MKRIKLKKYGEMKKSGNGVLTSHNIKRNSETPAHREVASNLRDTPGHRGEIYLRSSNAATENDRSQVRALDNKFMEVTKDKYDRFNIRHFHSKGRTSTNDKANPKISTPTTKNTTINSMANQTTKVGKNIFTLKRSQYDGFTTGIDIGWSQIKLISINMQNFD